ncbi:dihydroneopterin aldolase [Niabella ginsengisoli]|uniref:Dihydroneopterin aldolase n=1 Tax=Niabella ginsengisoli TaxID=522298 RepID=A0ABS9SM82_9BACT|nr:dihydroneopterin aldolase [Niabella ginsengisoli]MCH5598424.1 dihydroneopterin aldolase [Niabella ginsengisoli]MCH5599482.1 dihydroneopterin aldolase [Niabella ginsengisoli]
MGNEFELNISASFFSTESIVSEIDETINYAEIYELAKTEMLQPRELLEAFLTQLAEKIKEQFPQIVKLKMSLYKLQMPLTHFQGRIGVEIEKEY